MDLSVEGFFGSCFCFVLSQGDCVVHLVVVVVVICLFVKLIFNVGGSKGFLCLCMYK